MLPGSRRHVFPGLWLSVDGKGKARPSGARSGLEWLSFSVIRQEARAIRFDQNLNHIKVETAIRQGNVKAGRKKGAMG
jgi:hypothetical protein